jgi:hypothetical protein
MPLMSEQLPLNTCSRQNNQTTVWSDAGWPGHQLWRLAVGMTSGGATPNKCISNGNQLTPRAFFFLTAADLAGFLHPEAQCTVGQQKAVRACNPEQSTKPVPACTLSISKLGCRLAITAQPPVSR